MPRCKGQALRGNFARCWAFRAFNDLSHYSRHKLSSTIYLCMYKIRLSHFSVGEQGFEDVGLPIPIAYFAFVSYTCKNQTVAVSSASNLSHL